MKQRIMVVMVVCIIIFESSCAVQDDYILDEQFRTNTYLPEYDMQTEYLVKGAGSKVCRAGSMYYFSSPQTTYIYYYDETSGTYDKLCGKPECTHDSSKCNAHIESWSSTLQIYNGKLYFVSDGAVLYRMDLDGNNREKVMTFSLGNTANLKVVLHRGYIYYSEIQEVIEMGQSRYEYILRQAEIGENDTEKIILRQKTEKGIPTENWMIVGNTLYQYIADVFSSEVGYISSFYAYDIAMGQMKTLQNGENEWGITTFYVADAEIHMIQTNKNRERRIVTYDITSGQTQEGQILPTDVNMYAAFEIAQDVLIEYVAYCKPGEISSYSVKEKDGKVVGNGSISSPAHNRGMMNSLDSCGRDEKGFLFVASSIGAGTADVDLIRIPYDGTKPVILLNAKGEK